MPASTTTVAVRYMIDDVVETVAGLKQEEGGDLHLFGSTESVWTLVEHDSAACSG